MSAISYAYERFCRERFQRPTEKQVVDIERRIGVEFPDDYRSFLLEYNGGYFTEPTIEPQVEGCPEDCLTFMNGIGATHRTAELCSDANLALFSDNMPAEIVPIGYTLMGGLILLVTHPEGRGAILLKKAFEGSYFLANGIEEFFELLREDHDSQNG